MSWVATDSTQEIALGLVVGDKRNNGGSRDGVENAVDEINKRTDLLSGYRLKSIPLSVDSEVITKITKAPLIGFFVCSMSSGYMQ